jgi:hypothetical protein
VPLRIPSSKRCDRSIMGNGERRSSLSKPFKAISVDIKSR